MVTNEKVITIQRPVDEVFAYVSDAEKAPQWQKALVENRRITDGPLGIGTQYAGVRQFMGRKVESVIQYTIFELNKKIVFTNAPGYSPFEQTYLFESTAEGTRLTSRLDLETTGFLGLAKPLIASGVKREVDESFELLKNLLENGISKKAKDLT
jgi:uncharacterized protein YndB with AHSA1/START domain